MLASKRVVPLTYTVRNPLTLCTRDLEAADEGSLRLAAAKLDRSFPATPNFPCYIVAEVSANHKGSFDQAVETIKAAKHAGADAIKLQTYTVDTVTIRNDNEYSRIAGGTPWDDKTLSDHTRGVAAPIVALALGVLNREASNRLALTPRPRQRFSLEPTEFARSARPFVKPRERWGQLFSASLHLRKKPSISSVLICGTGYEMR